MKERKILFGFVTKKRYNKAREHEATLLRQKTDIALDKIEAEKTVKKLISDLEAQNQKYFEEAEEERLKQADDVCWNLAILMHTGALPIEDETTRTIIAGPMEKWMHLAAKNHEFLKEDLPEKIGSKKASVYDNNWMKERFESIK